MRREAIRANGVILTGVYFTCTRCGETKAASEFGLRTMANGEIRNQPQCICCRQLPPVRGRLSK